MEGSNITYIKGRKIVDGKYYCESCKTIIVSKYYNEHIKTKIHLAGIEKNEPKIKCGCGGSYYQELFNDHFLTGKHQYYLYIQEKRNRKVQQYEQNKDTKRCCKNCLKVDISEARYNPDLQLCFTCNEILIDYDKLCKYCNETKNISLFEKPDLFRCKKCATRTSLKNYHSQKS